MHSKAKRGNTDPSRPTPGVKRSSLGDTYPSLRAAMSPSVPDDLVRWMADRIDRDLAETENFIDTFHQQYGSKVPKEKVPLFPPSKPVRKKPKKKATAKK